MILELNPLKWFPAKPKFTLQASIRPADIETLSTPAKAVETPMANVFVTIMQWIGKEEKVLYADIIKYAPPIAKIAEILFPADAAAIASGTSAVLDATTLIQNAVLMVEQKYAASGVASGTGAQKSAEVLTLAGTAVSSLLTSAGYAATSAYIQSLITAVVGVLNAQPISVPVAGA